MVKVIVNRSNHGIAVSDIAKTLGTRVSATIVSNGPKAIASANEGVPIIIKFPKEQMSTDLHGVARLLTRPEPVAAPARRRSWWSSLVSPKANEAAGQ